MDLYAIWYDKNMDEANNNAVHKKKLSPVKCKKFIEVNVPNIFFPATSSIISNTKRITPKMIPNVSVQFPARLLGYLESIPKTNRQRIGGDI
mmetsp:Transcript_17427/g.28128  ORF Transcript_17427/g.28128 Transcript_17427/m.28128 type:complete len:92 (+) Transcript_17427:1336-1611(+)